MFPIILPRIFLGPDLPGIPTVLGLRLLLDSYYSFALAPMYLSICTRMVAMRATNKRDMPLGTVIDGRDRRTAKRLDGSGDHRFPKSEERDGPNEERHGRIQGGGKDEGEGVAAM